ncbi:MAG: RnfABCDGE type electron transport complex subunit D [Treponema sp.]|nr:RnfABCDGE type electron transport complex subunit D [Treponema sp.]
MKAILTVSAPSHIYGTDTIGRRMWEVVIALLPAACFAVYVYNVYVFFVMAASVLAAVVSEYFFRKIIGKRVTITDGSAIITGLLVAFNLPPAVPLWIPIVGSAFAIIVVKQFFGGLGQNFLNPALAARAFLIASFPGYMTSWAVPGAPPDAVTGPTLLAAIKETAGFVPQASHYMELLFGKVGGTIGEASAAALLVGGIYLIVRGIINWRTPVFYIASFVFFAFVLGRNSFFDWEMIASGQMLVELLAGGLLLGAFFMATDYATTPITPHGKVIMGIGCGFLTVLIRFYGGYPEGVSYAILIMNLVVPMVDRYIRPRVYGQKVGGKKKS